MHLTLKVGAGFAAVVAIAGLVDGCSKDPPHFGDYPVFPLLGKHAGLPCESCHGDGPKKPLSTDCIDCHAQDAALGHFPGQNCAPCHTTDGWNVVDTKTPTTTETGTVPTGPTDTGPTTTDIPEHWGLDPDHQETLCWTCHAEDRPLPGADTVPYDHWAIPTTYKADCGPCHTLDDWKNEALFTPVHAFRSPHGVMDQSFPAPQNEWIVACADCHPDSTTYTTYLCKGCHLTTGVNQTHITEDKQCPGVPVNAPVDENCLCCHPEGVKP